MLLELNETYEIVTEESAQEGDFAETGFNFENREMSFRELVDYLNDNGYVFLSDSHISAHTWVSTESEQDYTTGGWESKSLHCNIKDQRTARYWIKALNMIATF